MRPLHLSRVLREELQATLAGVHTPVMLWGPPGIGKSQIVMQVGDELDLPMIDIRLSQMEPSDCLLYTSPSPRDVLLSRMPSSA